MTQDTQEIVTVDPQELLVPPEQVERHIAWTSSLAVALRNELKAHGLTTRIGSREHINIDGWQLLGGVLGVTAHVVRNEPVMLGDERGFEAEAVLRDRQGREVGRAVQICMRSEREWTKRPSYALKGMASTRAIARAWRQSFGFVAAAGGMSATPTEEMQDVPLRRPGQPLRSQTPAQQREARAGELVDVDGTMEAAK